ncbi:LCP family protein [Streptacidiphilus sp. EB129]|uniref:LCP family protein n=1 Tax=Streptacidiphilus sp. EB129 TaxID=3156262 RepID=UPI0035186F26
MVVAGLVLLTAGAGYLYYQHLNGNITADSLYNGTSGSAGTEKVDAYGHSPINLLVIGSDTRSTAEDCKIGGDCANSGAGANADVEMLVHVSADRSNATVMSIPRDLETQLPACTDPKTKAHTDGGTGMINSALAFGPGCSVAAIHQLTGIPIDHFAMVDFSGVVAMSDAVGGVSVCVDNNVYDPYSHLKLAKGTHTLLGMSALQFVRTRHGFGDGGDLGRTYAQHTFLSGVIAKLKSGSTLTDPLALNGLAEAATKALTVDTGLGSIDKLVGLASDLNKVPSKRMTFTTMQNNPDPTNSNRVVLGTGAQTLFDSIINDQSLTADDGSKAAPSAGSSAAPASSAPAPAAAPQAVPDSQITVKVENGSGLSGRATTVRDGLVSQGYNSASSVANAASNTSTTTLFYGAGHQAEAKQLAASLGLPGSALQQGSSSRYILVIGTDWKSGATFAGSGGGSSASAAPVNTKVALANSHNQTADQHGCVAVSTQDTVSLPGYGGMSPIRAFSVSTDVPVSAP